MSLRFHSPAPMRVECTDPSASVPKLVASGAMVDLCRFTIDLDVIAYSLSRIARWGGHTTSFWSVASHSMLMADNAPRDLRREAWLHDASEGYIGDVATPTKRLLGMNSNSFERAFRVALGLAPEMPAAVKELDLRALATEARELFPRGSGVSWPFESLPVASLSDDHWGAAEAPFRAMIGFAQQRGDR